MAALFAFKLFHFPKSMQRWSFLFSLFDQRLHQVAKERRCTSTAINQPVLLLRSVTNKNNPCVFSRIYARTRPGEETRHLPSVLLCLQVGWKRLSSAKSLCKSLERSNQRGFSLCGNFLVDKIFLLFFARTLLSLRRSQSL